MILRCSPLLDLLSYIVQAMVPPAGSMSPAILLYLAAFRIPADQSALKGSSQLDAQTVHSTSWYRPDSSADPLLLFLSRNPVTTIKTVNPLRLPTCVAMSRRSPLCPSRIIGFAKSKSCPASDGLCHSVRYWIWTRGFCPLDRCSSARTPTIPQDGQAVCCQVWKSGF